MKFIEIIKRLDYESIVNLCQTSNEMSEICNDPDTWRTILMRDFNIDYKGEDPRNEYLFHRFVGFDLDTKYYLNDLNDKLEMMNLMKLPEREYGESFERYFEKLIRMLPRQRGEIWTAITYRDGSYPYFIKRSPKIKSIMMKKMLVSMSGVDMIYTIHYYDHGINRIFFHSD